MNLFQVFVQHETNTAYCIHVEGSPFFPCFIPKLLCMIEQNIKENLIWVLKSLEKVLNFKGCQLQEPDIESFKSSRDIGGFVCIHRPKRGHVVLLSIVY